MFSMLPNWNDLHPVVVHFPIALLLIAPLFVALSLFFPKSARTLAVSALLLMGIGTIGAILAVETGEAGTDAIEKIAAAKVVLERHEQLAELIPPIFGGLTTAFAALLLVPVLRRKELSRTVWTVLTGAFLVAYLAGSVVLIDAAHQGGRLVHELGTHSTTLAEAQATPTQPVRQDDNDD